MVYIIYIVKFFMFIEMLYPYKHIQIFILDTYFYKIWEKINNKLNVIKNIIIYKEMQEYVSRFKEI